MYLQANIKIWNWIIFRCWAKSGDQSKTSSLDSNIHRCIFWGSLPGTVNRSIVLNIYALLTLLLFSMASPSMASCTTCKQSLRKKMIRLFQTLPKTRHGCYTYVYLFGVWCLGKLLNAKNHIHNAWLYNLTQIFLLYSLHDMHTLCVLCLSS